LRPYLFRAIRNAALDERRSSRRRTDSIFEDAVATQSLGEAPPTSTGREEIEALLGRLSPDERECIVLRIYSGLTFREIAELRGVALPTVASWYRRGLQRLESLLKRE
jgi:RNA polymerase sigma-70 factor (ECF subfamily)